MQENEAGRMQPGAEAPAGTADAGRVPGILFGIAGLLAGAVLGQSLFAATAGLVLALLWAALRKNRLATVSLEQTLGRVEARVQALELQAETIAAPEHGRRNASAAQPAPVEPSAPESNGRAQTPSRPPPTSPQPARPVAHHTPATRHAANHRRPPRQPRRPGAIGAAFASLRGLVFGGNTVVRVGVLVLLVGISLLAKWAADHALFPAEARLAAASLIGLSLTALGYRLRDARPGFATTLQGGGIAALYLVVFAAFRLFAFLPEGLAFALLVVVAAAAGALSVLQRSQPLIFIASLGGYLAPIVTSTGQGSHVTLFSYYLLLNTAIAAVAWYRTWRALNVLAWIATYGIATTWGVLRYRTEHLTSTEPFVLAFFLLFTLIAVLFAWRQPPRLRGMVDGTLVFGTALVTLLLQARLLHEVEFGLAYAAAGLALFYALLGTWLWRQEQESLRNLCEAFIALAVGCGTMAIPFALDHSLTTALAWALEGAGLYWVGVRQQRQLPRYAGVALQGLAGLAFAVGINFSGSLAASQELIPLLNGRFLSCFALAFAGFFIARQAHAHRQALSHVEEPLGHVLGAWGLLWWMGGLASEIDRFVLARYELPVLLVAMALTAVGLERAARALAWSPGRVLSLALLPGAALTLPIAVDRPSHLLTHGTWLGWGGCLAAIYFLLHQLERIDSAALPRWPGAARGSAQETEAPGWLAPLYAPAFWLLAVSTALGMADIASFSLGLGGDWPLAVSLFAGAVIVLAALYATRHKLGPFGRHAGIQLTLAIGPVVAGLLAWYALVNTVSKGASGPLLYFPLLNPVDVALAAASTAALGWWAALRRSGNNLPLLDTRLVVWQPYAASALTLLAFGWLNGILIRSVHQWTDTPFRADALWDSSALQVSLSIAWTLVALLGMLQASKYQLRRAWLAFATLIGVVVIKLFTVDLAQLSTPAKIGTFLAVGLLLLIVGYLSPVPPAEGPDSEETSDPDVDTFGAGPSSAGVAFDGSQATERVR